MTKLLRLYIQNMNSASTIEEFKQYDSLFLEEYNELNRKGVNLDKVTDSYTKLMVKKRKLLSGR
jgi:hypothetical protein